MRFYTTVKLGARRSLTPEGFLLCEAVPIARTGVMMYAAGEVPVEPGPDGIIRIERTPEEVFRPETIASYEGKAVTLDHPSEDVSPENWGELAKGTALNVRRGSGIEDDLLLADLLITDKAAIKAVDKIREVSAGYDASYEQLEPGRGRQFDIVANHIALVENGRCGQRCAIGDTNTVKKNKWLDKIRAAFKARDEAEFEKTLTEPKTDEGEESDEEKKKREAEEKEKKTEDSLAKVLDAVTALTARVGQLEKTRDEKPAEGEESDEEKKKREAEEGKKTEDDEAEPDEEKKKKEDEEKTRDSAAVVAEAQDVFARAEIIAPGIQMSTVDAADPAKTRDGLCNLKRKALEQAIAGTNRDAVTPFLGQTPDFKALTCDAVNNAFVGASEIVKRVNNASQTQVTFDAGAKSAAGVARSIADINRRNADFWSGKSR